MKNDNNISRFTVEIPKDLYKLCKHKAVDIDVSLKTVIVLALNEFLKTEQNKEN